jgi:hypothetical protein
VISPENEPGNGSGDVWSNADFDGLISTSLGPTVGFGSSYNLPIAMPEFETPFQLETVQSCGGAPNCDFHSACTSDSNCLKYVQYAVQHGYGGMWPFGDPSGTGAHFQPIPAAFGTLPSNTMHAWVTENNDSLSKTYNCDGEDPPWDPSIADGLAWAENIHDFIVGENGSAWMYWNLSSTHPGGGPNGCNDGLTGATFSKPKRFYTVGNWSKFVRPGWVRIDSTSNPAEGIYVTAFKEVSSGNFAIVAINQNSSSASVSFSLSGFPSVTTVTPTLTSSNANLADQAGASVSNGAFSYSLPAASVTTFHGNASATASSPTKPNAPTGLATTVR